MRIRLVTPVRYSVAIALGSIAVRLKFMASAVDSRMTH